MEINVIQNIPLEVTREELFHALKMPEDMDGGDAEFVWGMLEECLKTAKPKAIYGVAAVEEKGADYVVVEGLKIVSPLVRKNLERVNRIIPFVATCGAEAEEWSMQYTDVLENYWADGIKLLLLGRIRKILSDTVKERYFPKSDMSAMSPGSLVEWPLAEQRNLFALIGGEKNPGNEGWTLPSVGVRLTDSCLMLPSKSGSGFFFSSKSHYENCTLCPILDCSNRRAEYAPPKE